MTRLEQLDAQLQAIDQFARLLDQHVQALNWLERALEVAIHNYRTTHRQVEARRVIECCRLLNDEVAYGRYLTTQRPT